MGKKERYTIREATEILMHHSTSAKCTKTPLKVRRNLSFLVYISSFKNWEDVKSDMNGKYSYPLRTGTWTLNIHDDESVEILWKKKVPLKNKGDIHIYINSKKNDAGLCRSIFFLMLASGDILSQTCLLQYHIAGEDADEVQFEVAPHGNRKHGGKPFYPLQKSTMEAIKNALSSKSPAVAHRNVCDIVGGVLGAEQPGQLPRSRQQMYDLKHKMSKTDQVDELLMYVKHTEKPIVLEHHDVPEDFWVLGMPHMCGDLGRFCTSEALSHPFSVDPTFNFGEFEVTPYSYKHLSLKCKRTNEPPVFIGPTAIHHSKTKATYKKMASAVVANSPDLAAKGKGFITDGEQALHDALGDAMKKSTGLRCFNHFRQNCKTKLANIGVRKQQDQKFFLDMVFGDEEEAILNSKDSDELKARLDAARPSLDEQEARLTKTSTPQFSTYLNSHRKMMKRSMIRSARMKAGMPCEQSGKPKKCYTNQSEAVNNKLMRQKEAISKNDKSKTNMTKLEFVRDVWEEVDHQQQSELSLAIFSLSEEFELADFAKYLQVEPDKWFELSPNERHQYLKGFNTLTIEDVVAKRKIAIKHNPQPVEPTEWQEFPNVISTLYSIKELTDGLIRTIIKEAERLLNSPDAIKSVPSLNPVRNRTKYFVAAKDCKKQMYECTVHRDHVSCTCPSYKYNALCKHGLCVANKEGILKEHIDFLLKSPRRAKPVKSGLVEPEKNAAGKKGGAHKNRWRPSVQNSSGTPPARAAQGRPFTEIHHNNEPLVVCFLSEEPRAAECKQCGTAFPRRVLVAPYDIMLLHSEKWMYPDPKCPNNKLPSSRFTTK